MLEQLFNLVKEQGQDVVVNNPDVPNEQNNNVLAEATSTIAGGLQNMLSGGGLQNVLGLFGGGNSGGGMNLTKNPIVNMMIGHFTSKLMGKFGLGSQKASGIAGSLIPSVLGSLINKTNDPSNSSFNLQNLLGGLMGGGNPQSAAAGAQGGGGFDLGGLLGNILGNSGGVPAGAQPEQHSTFSDLLGMVTGGAQKAQAQQAQGGGGIMDMLKGLIK
jgi:hypothetical protein